MLISFYEKISRIRGTVLSFKGLKTISLVATIISSMLMQAISPVLALSSSQKKALDSGIYYFNTEISAACQPGTNNPPSSNVNIGLTAIASKYKLHSAMVKELGGPVIDSHNATVVPPAVGSVLKIIIADVYLSQNPDLKKIITVKKSQLYQADSTSDFRVGEKVSMSEVLQKTLAESSNTGANIMIDESGGHSDATATANKLGYSDKTRIRAYYNHKGSDTPNESTVADLSKAMDKIFTQTSGNYVIAQQALKQSKKKWGLSSDANKWGGTSQVSGNSALFTINEKKYIVTALSTMDWEGDFDARSASGPIAIKNSTNEIVAALHSVASQPASSNTSTCCIVGGADLVGSENAEKIWNYLVSALGFTPIQAAGILGNIQQESGFSPTALNPDSGAYGIVQWYAGRRTALEDFARSKGVDKSDLGMQLEFLAKELNEGYKATVLDPIKASSSLEQVTLIWLERFEVPCIPGSSGCSEEMRKRLPFALALLGKYGSGSGGTASSSDSSTCGDTTSGEVVGEFSLPVARKWYSSNKVWFTKPHHTYPAADIPVPLNTPIYSVSGGKIVAAPVGGNCGNGLIIDAGNGIRFVYCHGMDGGAVPGAKNGDTVKAGQLIMRAGYTGRVVPAGVRGTHLHLEVEVAGENRCPQSLLVGIAEGKIPDIKSLPTNGCVG